MSSQEDFLRGDNELLRKSCDRYYQEIQRLRGRLSGLPDGLTPNELLVLIDAIKDRIKWSREHGIEDEHESSLARARLFEKLEQAYIRTREDQSQRSGRYCFDVPSTFLVCIDENSELAAWVKIRTWLESHAIFSVDGQGNPKTYYDQSQITVSLPGDTPGTPKNSTLSIQCHEVRLIGKTVD